MDQLLEELSTIEFPCKVQDDVIDKFFNNDHVIHGGQQQDDSVSTDSTVIRWSGEENTSQVASKSNEGKETAEENSENDWFPLFNN